MTRIIIMAANEVGVIADISRVLADADINIETISAEALGDKGVITLTTGRLRRRPCKPLRTPTSRRSPTTRWCSASPTSPGRSPG